jgi:two-component system cell cycle response regulator CpdR
MTGERVLIVDEEGETAALLREALASAGIAADCAYDAVGAMDKLRRRRHRAVVLDPMIRHRFNGYAVLNFIELEQPELLERLFLLTGMSEQTIRRTAPAMLPRLFRKPFGTRSAADAVIAVCTGAPRNGEWKSTGLVLLIEDDPLTAMATSSVLEERGYSVEWAENGSDALRALDRRTFEWVILDLILPDIDGFALLDSLRAEKPGLLRRVIVTTGMPGKYLGSIDGSTVAGILEKPLDVRKLDDILHAGQRGAPIVFEAGGEFP